MLILFYRVTTTTTTTTTMTTTTTTTTTTTPAAIAAGLPTPAQHAADLANHTAVNAPGGHFGHQSLTLWPSLGLRRRESIAHARLIDGQYGAPAATPCDRCTANGLVCRQYHPAFYTGRSLGHVCSECRLANQACNCPKRGAKPRPSRASRGKGRDKGGRGGQGGASSAGVITVA